MSQKPDTTPISTHPQWHGGPPQPSPSSVGPGASLHADQLERIIRRAAELQNRGGDQPGRLTPEEVIRIAEEVGLEAPYVRRAIAEMHAESLVPDEVPESRLAVALVGSGRVQVRRVMAGDAPAIQQRIESLLREREGLTPLRRGPLRSVWERARGMTSKMRRTLGDHGFVLAKARSVDLSAGQLEPGWSLVTLTADFTNRRNDIIGEQVWWPPLVAVFAANIISGWFDISATSAGGLLIGLTAFGISAAIALNTMTRQVNERRQRLALALDDLLDRAA
jgi:hypothetical protein